MGLKLLSKCALLICCPQLRYVYLLAKFSQHSFFQIVFRSSITEHAIFFSRCRDVLGQEVYGVAQEVEQVSPGFPLPALLEVLEGAVALAGDAQQTVQVGHHGGASVKVCQPEDRGDSHCDICTASFSTYQTSADYEIVLWHSFVWEPTGRPGVLSD